MVSDSAHFMSRTEYNNSLKAWRNHYYRLSHEVDQVLGKALGYPWYKDDQENFPGATEADGVCTGEHCAETIIYEAADTIRKLRQAVADANAALEKCSMGHILREGDGGDEQEAL